MTLLRYCGISLGALALAYGAYKFSEEMFRQADPFDPWNVEMRRLSIERIERERRPCVDLGGVPVLSAFDGRLVDCKFPPK